ncbi:MAG: ATP-binding protein [Desulfobacterales bacterium]|nr:ATP-binding protein [Desulfobacterales bacterium]
MPNTNSPDLHANPFIIGPPITDPRFFVGRKQELQAVINCMDGVQPTSVNIVGETRIGKTSLLYL